MASSNRHWPSLFKSKPCNTHHNQWQHDTDSSSLVSSGCYRLPYTSVAGCEERTPEPKPRWNPKPEQIRILEEIFNSGMVNPPRDEIRKIRAQLQEYGQVGDANVFYWFQNRKSRSKQKSRHIQSSNQQCSQHRLQQTGHNNQTSPSNTSLPVAPASASSSSEKSSPKDPKRALSLTPPIANSVNQAYFQAPTPADLVPEPFFFPMQQAGPGGIRADALGIDFSELSNVVQGQGHTVGPCTGLLLSGDVLDFGAVKKQHQRDKVMIIQPQPSYSSATPISIAHSINDLASLLTPSTTSTNSSVTLPSTINQVQDAGELPGPAVSAIRSTVFINDVALEVVVGSFNVREAFGDDVVLIHSSGQPVLTDERGVTLCPLQHGASYYLVPLFHVEGGKTEDIYGYS